MKVKSENLFKIVLLIMILSMGLIFASCKKRDNIVPPNTSAPGQEGEDVGDNMIELPEEYELNTWTQKFWEGNISYNEPVSFTEDEEGNLIVGKLMYEPDEILEVRSGVGYVKLYEGKDYVYNDGKFDISDTVVLVKDRDYTVKNGKIKLNSDKVYIDVMTYDEMFPFYKEGEAKTWLALPSDNSRYINIDGTIKNAQIYVTYTHSDTWKGFVPGDQSSHLPKTMAKLEAKQSFNFYIYGDSIATGADATGNRESCIDVTTLKKFQFNSASAPKTPAWAEMAVSKLKSVYGYEEINKVNKAAGGSTSDWGKANAEALLCSDPENIPDIVILAFGMNEPGRSGSEMKENLNTIIDAVLKVNPDCEFILMSTIESNPMYGSHNFPEQAKAMYELQQERPELGIAVCPVNSVYRGMLEAGKTFCDLTSNNINHPNDFLCRVYAMTVLATMGN